MGNSSLSYITGGQYEVYKGLRGKEQIIYEKDMTYAFGLQIVRLVDIENITEEMGTEERVYRVTGRKWATYNCEELGIRSTRWSLLMEYIKEKIDINDEKHRSKKIGRTGE